MTEQEFKSLQRGDIICRKVVCVNGSSNEKFIVDGNYGGRVTAIVSADVTNPAEWILVRKANPPRVTMEFRNNRWEIVDQE